MTRYQLIERIVRQVYGEQPSDDSNITVNLINQWVNDGIAQAAKRNYAEAIQVDGVAYVNNSFYTTFKGLAITAYEPFTYQVTLPQIPFGLGKDEGISSLTIIDSNSNNSFDCVPLSQNQYTYYRGMPAIPNKVLYYSEGTFAYLISPSILSINYTAKVKMVSGGDSTNLNSTLNVPDDYVNLIIEYVSKMLIMERQQVKDITNDGQDN
jgi:hypothetical protein